MALPSFAPPDVPDILQREENHSLPLGRGDFRCVAQNGFGDGWNSYSHTMAWFDDHLYVGTSRAILAMVKVNDPPPQLNFWPINSPDNVYDIDRRAQIWRYSPATNRWDNVFRSPYVKGRTGETVARDIGYRGSCVHQGPHDPKPALYVCTWSSSKGLPPVIMRSYDGERFEPIPRPSWGDSVNTFRILVSFKGKLYTAPTGATAGYGQAQECVSGLPIVWECADPDSGVWEPANPPGFGNSDNVTIFEVGIFDDHLYAGTINPVTGYEVWKTRAEGKAPYEWKKVVTHGAYRGPLNEIAVSLVPFKNALYVGSGIINGGYDRRRKVGPAAAEIIRIHPDDSWDLVVGNARLTPDGLKYPISTFLTGFDNLFNGYIWRMVQHRGHLYVGTFKWNQLLPFMPLEKWPSSLQLMIEARGIDEILSASGGVDLWRTGDGFHWSPVTRTGFENPYNWGIRTVASTPYGVFIGTANPFGPEVGIKRNKVWEYVENERGATEIWLGSKQFAAGMPEQGKVKR